MAKLQAPSLHSNVHESASSHCSSRFISEGLGRTNNHGPGFPGLKKRGHAHGSRSWIKINQNGDSKILELDKATVMRDCSLPARDLRLLDPLFIYPSTILGREKAIVVSLELIRCIITADEVILMNSLEGCVVQYKSELCKRLQTNKDQSDDLPFEFRALELALEITCMSLDAQVKDLEMEIHPVLDELASSISTLNLERVRRFKGHLLALTQRVQKVCDEIEHLMDDDGDMAEMYLTEKKQRKEVYVSSDIYDQSNTLGSTRMLSKSAPVSPVGSISGTQKLQRTFSSMSSSKHGSLMDSSSGAENQVDNGGGGAWEYLSLVRKLKLRRSDKVLKHGLSILNDSQKRSALGPEEWTLYEQVAIAAMDCQCTDVAKDCIKVLQKKFPESKRVGRLEAMLLEAKGSWAEAEKAYSSLLEDNPLDQVILKRRAAMTKAQGNISGAIERLNQYLETFMADHDAWRELAEIYVSLQMYKQAAFCYEELILSQPMIPLYHLTYADVLYTLGGLENLQTAKKYYASTIELTGGKNTRALFGICLCSSAIAQLTKGRNKEDKDSSELQSLAATVLEKDYKDRSPSNLSLLASTLRSLKLSS